MTRGLGVRECQRSRRVAALITVAAILVLANLGPAFLTAAPRLLNSTSSFAGSTRPSITAPWYTGPRHLGMAADAGSSESLRFLTILSELSLALFPTILIELAVLGSERPASGSNVEGESGEFVVNSNDSIAVAIPFQAPNWDNHRQNPKRFWTAISDTLMMSSLLPRLQGPLFVLNCVSAFVLVYSLVLVPDQGLPLISLPLVPWTLSSFALGLLLTYRANQSTLRYIKARDLWGDMLNISRDLTQQSSQWANRDDFVDFARWVPAFATCLMCALRSPEAHDLAKELRAAAGSEPAMQGAAAGLSEEEIQLVVSRPQGMLPHHFVTHMLRTKTAEMGLPLVQRTLMESNITRLVNDMGACENIFATPIPVSYSKQTTIFLFLWLFFLPWGLGKPLGVGVVFAQQLLSLFLLGIEDIGIQIEQPFDVLPLKKIVFKIANEAQIVRANFDALEDAAAVSRKRGELASVVQA